ncbi:MAG: hypothetical protein H7259_09160 [Cytophagales bacterium]|nr:hypothetical protein [Cytophaga sp.]
MDSISAKKTSFLIKSSCILFLFLHSFIGLSDPPCPPGPDGLPNCGDIDPSIPFDNGALLLIAAGVALLFYKKKKGEKSMNF